MNKNFKVTTLITPKSFRKCYYEIILSNKTNHLRFFFLILFAGSVMLINAIDSSFNTWLLLAVAIFPMIGFALSHIYRANMATRDFKKILQDRYGSTEVDVILLFTEDAIYDVTNAEQERISYTQISMLLDRAHYLSFTISARAVYTVFFLKADLRRQNCALREFIETKMYEQLP